MNKTIVKQIIAPLQQWLLEQGQCVSCGRYLISGRKGVRSGLPVVKCACGELYLYLASANLYKRLSVNKYA